jgi:hypothetical protein
MIEIWKHKQRALNEILPIPHVPVFIKTANCFRSWDGVSLSPLVTPASSGPLVPGPDDKSTWRSTWDKNWQGKPKYWENLAPLPLWQHRFHTTWLWDRTWAVAVGSWRLTAWVMARFPNRKLLLKVSRRRHKISDVHLAHGVHRVDVDSDEDVSEGPLPSESKGER